MAEAMGFKDLPEEIILVIFRFMPLHMVRSVLPRVCRLWALLAKSPMLWKHLTVKPPNWCGTDFDSLSEFLEKTPEVRCVDMPEWMIMSWADKLPAELEAIRVFGITLHDSPLFADLKRFTKLRKLHFPHENLSADYIDALLRSVPQLEDLTLTRSFYGTLKPATIKLMKNLTHLSLCFYSIDSTIVSQLTALPRLRRLSVTVESEKNLQRLSNLPLYQLDITGLSNYRPRAVLMDSLFTSGMPLLQHLRVYSQWMSDDAALVIRKHCPALRTLDVSAIEPLQEISSLAMLHFLHLPLLNWLDVNLDYNVSSSCYKRERWTGHVCEPNQPCPVGVDRSGGICLDSLLEGWQERPYGSIIRR